jgi:hypothetical protein
MNDWKTSIPQDDKVFIKFKNQTYPTNKVPQESLFMSNTMQILAKTRFNIEPGINMDYYNANYSAPAELPDKVYDSFKKYYRNRLGMKNNHILVPRSETGNILRTYDLNFDKSKSTLRLATPITQIVVNGRKILVKTMGHVYCLNDSLLEPNSSSEASDLFSFLDFGMEPLHITASRILNESVVLLPDGSVRLWDLHLNTSSKWGDLSIFGQSTTAAPSGNPLDPTEYFTCEFATHPKQLYLANGDLAALGDLRAQPKNLPILYHSTTSDRITDIKPNPFVPFQFAVSLGSKLILRDTRFLKKVILGN